MGAAAIAPEALILPAISHPEAIVYAVAARDLERAKVFAKNNGIEKVYGGKDGYQGARLCSWVSPFHFAHLIRDTELLDDPLVDAVYNPVSIAVTVTSAVSNEE